MLCKDQWIRHTGGIIHTKDIIGQRFGKLTAMEIVGKYHRTAVWRCKCDCGAITEVKLCNLTNGNTKSCGCLKRVSHD